MVVLDGDELAVLEEADVVEERDERDVAELLAAEEVLLLLEADDIASETVLDCAELADVELLPEEEAVELLVVWVDDMAATSEATELVVTREIRVLEEDDDESKVSVVVLESDKVEVELLMVENAASSVTTPDSVEVLEEASSVALERLVIEKSVELSEG